MLKPWGLRPPSMPMTMESSAIADNQVTASLQPYRQLLIKVTK